MEIDRAAEFDVVGIGVGPSNLSLAALLDPVPGVRARFFERRTQVRWHPGLQLAESELQVSFLKDLVTLVDPTSRFSFLNFLAETGRLHRFAAMPGTPISRAEFESYYAWATASLTTVELDQEVREVSFDGAFTISTAHGSIRSRDLCIGVGPVPSVPSCVQGQLGATMLHAGDFLDHPGVADGRRVVVIGGGQSGAEIAAHLLDRTGPDAVKSVTWVSRRPGFLPLDDSPFTNEWFQPDYVQYFRNLPVTRRRDLLAVQQLASDGISTNLLQRIYRRLYHNDFVAVDRLEHTVLPGTELIRVDRRFNSWRLRLRHADTGAVACIDADVVILATGYRYQLPHFLHPLAALLPPAQPYGLPLRADYSLPWQHADTNRLFFLNAGRLSHGIADPNLSLASWRSAIVANSLSGRDVYATGSSQSASQWDPLQGRIDESASAAAAERAIPFAAMRRLG
jgi:lysine N6-hydroxylase